MDILIIFYRGQELIIHKQLEMHGCMLSNIATDARVLKHQAISVHSAEWILIILDGPFMQKYSICREHTK